MAGGAEAPAATAVAGPAGPEGAIAGAEAETAAPTIEDLKAAARDLAAKKGFDVCKKVFDDLGIAKPGKTPDDKIPAALAAVREALA